jgi:transposase
MIDLARSGRTLRSLSGEFSVTETTIRSWLRQADLDTGRRTDGLTTDEKQELARLKKENARLREERDILEKAAAWFAQESASRKKRSDS